MRVLVTGGLGFIGSSVAEKLLSQGHHVLSIDNLDSYYDPKIKLTNMAELSRYKNFTGEIFDLGNSEKLTPLLKVWQPEVVFHAAGKAGVRPSLKNPTSYIYSNIEVLTSLLESMRICGLNKLIFCSSSSVYGAREEQSMSEEVGFDQAISFYAASKQCGELINRMYHNLYNFSVLNLRFFTVYGPKQRPDLAIHKFLKASIESKPITLFGDGSMKRDYTYIDDIVDGVCKSIDHIFDTEDILYETYNLGNSNPVSLSKLINAIESVTGSKMRIRRQEAPSGDVPITFADITKAKRVLGYNPKVSLNDGISSFYQWMLKQQQQEAPEFNPTSVHTH